MNFIPHASLEILNILAKVRWSPILDYRWRLHPLPNCQLLDDLEIVIKSVPRKTSSPALIISLGLPYSATSKQGPPWRVIFSPTPIICWEKWPRGNHSNDGATVQESLHNDWIRRASQLGMSLREVVTLASIMRKRLLCQKRSLSFQRLPQSIRQKILCRAILQWSTGLRISTEIWPDPIFKGYHPIIPISTTDSANADMHPERIPSSLPTSSPVSYLYFVSKNDGSHYFSSTMEEHNQAVWKYQKRGLGRLSKWCRGPLLEQNFKKDYAPACPVLYGYGPAVGMDLWVLKVPKMTWQATISHLFLSIIWMSEDSGVRRMSLSWDNNQSEIPAEALHVRVQNRQVNSEIWNHKGRFDEKRRSGHRCGPE